MRRHKCINVLPALFAQLVAHKEEKGSLTWTEYLELLLKNAKDFSFLVLKKVFLNRERENIGITLFSDIGNSHSVILIHKKQYLVNHIFITR